MPCGVCFDASRNGPNCEWLQPNQKLPFTMNTKQSCNSLQANYAGVVLGIICLLEMNQIVCPGLMLLKFKQRIKVLNNKSFLRSWTIELSIFVEAKTSKLFSTSNRWRIKFEASFSACKLESTSSVWKWNVLEAKIKRTSGFIN